MQILTPSGYVHPSALADGSDVCAFDENNTGVSIVNKIEDISFVDYAEWCRWWKLEDETPLYNWVRVNGEHVLFREQSVWRNGNNVVHARDLVVGDVIYDDQDRDILITSVAEFEDRDAIWYGLTVHNATRFWVGGTASMTSSNTTNWAATSGTAGGQSVPGSADSATWDSLSGGGTTTMNFGGTWTVQSVAMGAFTGTWDNSVNNNNVTCSASAGFNGSGGGTRSIKMGSATYSLSNNTAQLNFTTTTGLTLTAGSSTITFSGATTGSRSFFGGAQTFGTVNFGACTGAAFITMTGGWNIGTCNYTAPSYIQFSSGTYTHNATAYNGSPGSYLAFYTSSAGVQITIAASGSTFSWCSFRDINFTGSPTCQNCVDLGNNAGMTINVPQVVQPIYGAGI